MIQFQLLLIFDLPLVLVFSIAYKQNYVFTDINKKFKYLVFLTLAYSLQTLIKKFKYWYF